MIGGWWINGIGSIRQKSLYFESHKNVTMLSLFAITSSMSIQVITNTIITATVRFNLLTWLVRKELPNTFQLSQEATKSSF